MRVKNISTNKTIIKKNITEFLSEILLNSFINKSYNELYKIQQNNSGAPARI